MRPVTSERAQWLAMQIAETSVEDTYRHFQIELLCGIAAIRDPHERREVAYEAVREIFLTGGVVDEMICGLIDRINEEWERVNNTAGE